MSGKPVANPLLFLLTALALVLLIGVAVIQGVAAILGGMGDAPGSRVVGWIALAAAMLLVVDLVCLLLALAINSLADSDEPPDGS